jgi:hypothetical protein
MRVNIEILSDGRTCWVNGADGCCLGRFVHSKLMVHMDVHRDADGQAGSGSSCLGCARDATWPEFKVAMLRYHGVEVPDAHKPVLA